SWVDHPSWEVVDEATSLAGRDVAHLLTRADEDELRLTSNAQLATFVLSLVALDAIERVGLAPTVCAGHSLGEYSALTASGAMTFEDGVRLVSERGEAMHAAAEENPGTMAAILGLKDDLAEQACSGKEGVWIANYNAEGQVVIAGTQAGVEEASNSARELGAKKVIALNVAGAFHTPLMAPAAARLRKALSSTRFLLPEVPVVANVDARAHRGAGEWRSLLAGQLCSPVRWRQSLQTLGSLGTTCVVEVGPGGVLAALTKRALKGVQTLAVAEPEDIDKLVQELAGSDHVPPDISSHQGEHLFSSERVVVAPAAGVFQPDPALEAPHPGRQGTLAPGAGEAKGAVPKYPIAVGDLLGTVGSEDVRTPFAGQLVAFIAHPGERVVKGQPVAWLHVPAGGEGS
ncbi:MAG: ACP S-malonyltransferase, partial [Acidimicrobiales bacterium]